MQVIRVSKFSSFFLLLVFWSSNALALLNVNLSAPSTSTGSYTVTWDNPYNLTFLSLQEKVGGGAWTTVQTGGSSKYFSGKAGGTYQYRVRSYLNLGPPYGAIENFSAAITTVVNGTSAPSVPGTITGASSVTFVSPATTRNVSLSWAASTGTITSYQLQRQTNGGSWSAISTPYALSYSEDLPAGVYGFRVRACNNGNCSSYTAVKTVTVQSYVPPSYGLTVPSTNGTGSYTVTWNADNTTLYSLQEKNGSSWTTINSGSATSQSFSGKTVGTYTYRVEAKIDLGWDPSLGGHIGYIYLYGLEKSVVVGAIAPGTPSSISVPSTDNNGAFTVSWGSASGLSSGYKYQLQQQKNSGSWTTLQTSSATSKAVSGLGDGTYRYRVRACNYLSSTTACGSYRTSGNVILADAPGTPSSIAAPTTDGNGAFTVSWGTSSGTVDQYQLYQQKNGGSWTSVYSGGTATSKAISGLGDGTYLYRVRACNSYSTYTACSGYRTETVAVTVANAPGTPSSVSAPSTDGNGAFTVSWGTSSGSVDQYQLYQQKNGGSWTSVYSGGTATSKAISGLSDGSYLYRVRACNTYNGYTACSGYRTESAAAVVANAPGTPSSISAPASDNNGAYTVSWGSATGTVDQYKVYQQKDGGSWTSWYTGTSLSKAVTGMPDGSYLYRVRACNTQGSYTACSSYRTESAVLDVANTPGVPSSVSAPSTDNNGAFTVSWGTSSGTVDQYQLYQQKNGGSWTGVYSGGTATSKAISGLGDGSYLYRVRACNTQGSYTTCSSYRTETVAVVVANAPGMPASISNPSTDDNGAFTVSWGTSSGSADLYRLEQQFNGGSWTQIYSGSATSHGVSGLGDGDYAYRVRGCNTYSSYTGCSSYRTGSSATTVGNQPGMPAPVSVPATDNNGAFTVTWTTASGSVDYYDVEQQKNGGSWSNIYNGTSTSKSVTGLTDGSYLFRARACNTQGSFTACSSYSNSGTALVSIVPGIPSSISAPSTDDNGAYSVSWGSASGSVDRYEVFEQKNGGSWTSVYSGSSTSTSLSGKSDGSYLYRVRACNVEGSFASCSSYRTESAATVVANKPAVPASISVPSSSASGAFTVSWGSATHADTYALYQQTNGGSWSSIYSGSATSRSVSGLSDNTYAYRVRACNTQGSYTVCSDYKTSGTVTVLIDSDGDGVPDVADVFPNDGDEWEDSDGDGVGNNGDAYAFDPTRSVPEVITINTPSAPVSKPTVSLAAVNASEVVGATQGSFRVNESGAATYSLPIFAVQGTAGVTPQVSLNYASQGGNGIVGVGWSIGGLSAISRCRQTLSQDGKARPISLAFGNDGDRLCLDGQRLILESGTYGSASSTYRTEIDSYSTVSFDGTYFTVTRKDGSVSEYGNGNDSINSVDGVAFTWAISRFEDSMGNPITFDYIDDVDGHRIDVIEYAYGSTTPASIDFDYETRPDTSVGFLAGDTVAQNKRLTDITVSNDGSTVRYYELTYKQLDSVITKSYVTEIEECISSGSGCLEPLTLGWTWPTAGALSGSSTSVTLDNQDDRHSSYQPADVNGDGLLDLVWLEPDYDNDGKVHDQYFRFAIANGNGYSAPITFYSDSSNHDTPYPWHVIDYNADGRQDVIFYRYGQGRWYVALSEPQSDGSWELSSSLTSTSIIEKEASFADLNSDGLLDVYYESGSKLYVRYMERDSSKASNSSSAYHFGSQYEQGDKVITSTDWTGIYSTTSTYHIVPSVVADINSDGRVEILLEVESVTSCIGGYEVCPAGNSPPTLAQKYQFFTPTTNGHDFVTTIASGLPSSFYSNVLFRTGDINGDGNVDLLRRAFSSNSGKLYLMLNDGTGDFTAANTTMIATLQDASNPQAIDYNRDGYPDIIWHDLAFDKISMRAWDPVTNAIVPNTSTVTLSTTNGSANQVHQFYDTNGDSLLDYVHVANDRLYVYEGTGTSGPTGVINSFDNNMGSVTNITYENMSDSSHYEHLKVGGSAQNFTWDGQNYTFSLANKGNFYTALNGDWDIPAGSHTLGKLHSTLEFKAPVGIVTFVESSAPTAANASNKSGISYYYGEAKLQAAGRGLLGFHKIKTVDEQSGVETTSTYRQDFPFIGSPSVTEVRSSSGHLLSEATNVWKLHGWDGSTGTPAAPYQPYISESTEKAYDLASNGASQGSLLKTVVTETIYDDNGSGTSYGNVDWIEVTTTGDSHTYVTETNNTYGSSVWEKTAGRLTLAVVDTSRDGATPVTRTSAFEYYTQGQGGLLKKEIIEPNNSAYTLTTEYGYDTYGNKTSATVSGSGVVSRTTSSTYEDGRYPKASINANGHTVSEVLAWNELGQPTSVINYTNTSASAGVTTTFEYDRYGRKYLEYSPTGAYAITLQTSSANDCPSGTQYVQTAQAAGGGSGSVCFDALGRKIRSVKTHFDGTQIYQDTEYDDLGRVDRQSIPYQGVAGYWTSNIYDILGRVTSVVQETYDYGNLTTTSVYSGRTTTVTNPKSQTLTTVVNNLGEKVSVTDTLSGVITYGYDQVGNLTSTTVTGPNQATGVPSSITTTIGYDAVGRKDWMDDPDKGYWDYSYNVYGELTSQTDAKSQATTMTYDKLGRMVTRTDAAGDIGTGETTTWYYDTATNGLGQLDYETQTNSGYSRLMHYDSYGRAIQVDTILGIDESYSQTTTFDEYGRVFQSFDAMRGTSGTETSYNSYGYVDIVYDAETIDGVQTELHNIQTMDVWGNVDQEIIGSGATITRTYSPGRGLLTQIDTTTAVVFNLQLIDYTYDELGNLETRHIQSSSRDLDETFSYDGLNRLTQVVKCIGSTCSTTSTMTYDSFGNIDTKSGVGTYTYGAGNAGPHAVTSADGTTYAYDANGNMNNDTVRQIDYSSFDKPLYMKNKSTLDETNFYYGSDRGRYKRVDKISGSTKTTYYMGSIEKVVSTGGAYTLKRYVTGNTLWLYHFNSDGYILSKERKYLLKDSLGSTDVVMKDYLVDQEMSFDAWGQRRSVTTLSGSGTYLPLFDVSNMTRGFTGHEHVDSMGLIHMNGRIYDPKLGRFLQADPLIQAPSNTQSYNRYTYVFNNPLVYTDPSGYSGWTSFRDNVVKPVVQAVVTFYCVPCGMAYAAASVKVETGSWNGALRAATITGVSAAAFNQIGAAFDAPAGSGFWAKGGVGHVGAHAVTGGVISELQGGKFGHGFISAGVTKGVMGAAGFDYSDGNTSAIVGRTVVAAIIGGTVSEMTGGKFMNGAATAALAHLMNQEMSAEQHFQKETGMTRKEFINLSSDEQIVRLEQHQRSLATDEKIANWKFRIEKSRAKMNEDISQRRQESRPSNYKDPVVEISEHMLELMSIIPTPARFSPFNGLKGEAFDRGAGIVVDELMRMDARQ